MHKTILEDFEYAILPASGEFFYVWPPILFKAMKYFIKLYLFGKRKNACYFASLSYLLGCIEYIRPKTVITFIDNSCLFWAVSRIYKNAVFYAIQNGVKNQYSVRDWMAKPPRPGSVISMPNFVCFGKYEKDLYEHNGHQVDQYYPVGSLIGGYFKKMVSPGKAKISHDICLVSQWRKTVMNGLQYPELKKGLVRLHGHLREFINKEGKPLSLCIATCQNDPDEKKYFRELYGESVMLVEFDRMFFSTYRAMDACRLVLAQDSCAAYEAFGWGKKVLFCNFTGNEVYNFPKPGPWSLTIDCYEEFKNSIGYLLELDDREFEKIAIDGAKYMMNYDFSRPAHVLMKDKIREAITIG